MLEEPPHTSSNHGARELIYSMTLLALEVIRLSMTGRDHACRIPGMTAAAVGRLPLINTLIMTGPAFSHAMCTAQREAGQVMIKARLLPEILRVTILTRHQLTIMRIILMMALAAFLT